MHREGRFCYKKEDSSAGGEPRVSTLKGERTFSLVEERGISARRGSYSQGKTSRRRSGK